MQISLGCTFAIHARGVMVVGLFISLLIQPRRRGGQVAPVRVEIRTDVTAPTRCSIIFSPLPGLRSFSSLPALYGVQGGGGYMLYISCLLDLNICIRENYEL